METNYEEIAYNDLKKIASEKGLDTKGTKAELVARLVGKRGASITETGAPALEPSVPSKSSSDLDKKYQTKAMMTKKALDAQPKVMVFIPFEAGENAAQAAQIKLPVNINGYQFDIPRGTAVNVPQQVAEMIRERLESEGKAGRTSRVDASPERQEALS